MHRSLFGMNTNIAAIPGGGSGGDTGGGGPVIGPVPFQVGANFDGSAGVPFNTNTGARSYILATYPATQSGNLSLVNLVLYGSAAQIRIGAGSLTNTNPPPGQTVYGTFTLRDYYWVNYYGQTSPTQYSVDMTIESGEYLEVWTPEGTTIDCVYAYGQTLCYAENPNADQVTTALILDYSGTPYDNSRIQLCVSANGMTN